MTQESGLGPERRLMSEDAAVRLGDLVQHSALRGLQSYRGQSVLIETAGQLPAVLALLELDGLARRIVLCPPDLAAEHRPALLNEAEVDAIVAEAGLQQAAPLVPRQPERETEWILLTSGTSGRPKLVRHTLASLTEPMRTASSSHANRISGVWSTFYDVRRYGGLTILLRALVSGTSMVLSSPHETVSAFLSRATSAGVKHISGTPTHWRQALMSPQHRAFRPQTVRLSGEIAAQASLDQLSRAFPDAQVTHAFASTEAGVAFEVTDGRAGFPTAYLDRVSPVSLRIEAGTLRIRSARTADFYLAGPPLRDADGYVDTGDIISIEGDRCFFAGRATGVVNVGGSKVHPEEIEAVLNDHPDVQMALVTARRSPITGALVTASIVPADPRADPVLLHDRVLEYCRATLPPHKVPALLRVVPHLAMNAAGKLARA